MRLPPALLALAPLLLLAPGRGWAAVPSPTQITITAEDFKTVVHWQYPAVSETARFTVEIKPYNRGAYKTVLTCVNISAHFCDLSGEIEDPFSSHWLRVKAAVESEQSEYAESSEFVLQQQVKIGPPVLHLLRQDDKIIVDIYHPQFPSEEICPWITDVYSDVRYTVTFEDSKNQSKKELRADDCNIKKCSLDIPISSEGYVYCVSAKGSFYDDLILGAWSEESCIPVPLKQTLSSKNIVVVVGVILIFGLFLSTLYGYKKLRKKNIKLPKSLVSVIRNLNTSKFLETKPETKCNSVVSLMPDEPALPADEEVHSLKVEQNEGITNTQNSSEGASSVLLSEGQGNSGEVSVQESTGEVSSDDEQNHKGRESYFPSDNNQTEICSNCSDAEVSTKEVQQTVHPSSTLKFSGYDKPHVPLDMLIDVGEERPVVAYRPTEQPG